MFVAHGTDDDEDDVILLIKLDMGRDFVLFPLAAVAVVKLLLADEIKFPFLSFVFGAVGMLASSCTRFPLASSWSFMVSTFSDIPVTERDLFLEFFS